MRIGEVARSMETDNLFSNTLRAMQFGRESRKSGLERDPLSDEAYQNWLKDFEERESFDSICVRMNFYWMKGWDQYRPHIY